MGRHARRQVRWASMALLVLVVLLAACTGGGGGAPSPGGGGQARKTLTFAMTADPGFLAFETSGIATYTYTRLIYDGLFRIRPDTHGFRTVDPDAAESWDISPDQTVWTFHLRGGLTFTNGDPLTAGDVKFSIEKLLDPKFTASGFLGSIDHVDALDDKTVVITLKAPDPSFWVIVAEIIDIYPQKVVEQMGDARFQQKPVGSGPYSVVEWKKDESVEFAANPDYWKGAPAFSKILIRIIPETSTRVAELQGGNVDAAPIDVVNIPEIEGNDQLHVVGSPGGTIAFVRLRFDKSPTDDPRVRQAMNLAVDRKTLADTLYKGHADLPASVLPSNSFGALQGEGYAFDQDQARSLLQDYGKPVKFDLEFVTSELNNDLAQALADFWTAVGMGVTLKPFEEGVFIDRTRGGIDGGGKIGAVSIGQWSGVTEPVLVYQFNILPSGVFGYTNIPEVKTAVDEATTATDDATREAALRAAEQTCFDQACWVFLWVPEALVGAKSNVEVHAQSEGVWDLATATSS
jgi:peptide/nickel transport system substrate-binding protein